MTSFACTTIDCGTLRGSALAILKFMTSFSLVACSIGPNLQPLQDITAHCFGLEATSGKPDMPVGSQKVERGLGNLRVRERAVVDRIAGNRVNAQQVAETRYVGRRRRLPDHH